MYWVVLFSNHWLWRKNSERNYMVMLLDKWCYHQQQGDVIYWPQLEWIKLILSGSCSLLADTVTLTTLDGCSNVPKATTKKGKALSPSYTSLYREMTWISAVLLAGKGLCFKLCFSGPLQCSQLVLKCLRDRLDCWSTTAENAFLFFYAITSISDSQKCPSI